MKIFVSLKDKNPLYEQVKNQIIKLILTKELKEGDRLPSIRGLSKDLRVGVVTIRRAYDDLVNDGYLISKEAKGFYVDNISLKTLKKEALEEFRDKLIKLKKEADLYKITKKELIEIIGEVYEK